MNPKAISEVTWPDSVQKRGGQVVPFDEMRVRRAIEAGLACDETWSELAPGDRVDKHELCVDMVLCCLKGQPLCQVEEVQDLIEQSLIELGFTEGARAFIRYREKRTQERRALGYIPAHIKERFDSNKRYFESPLQQFQYLDKYARWNEALGVRETWEESVARVVEFFWFERGHLLPMQTKERLYQGMLNHHAMPSMRAIAMAGPAAKRNNACLYNCSYQAIDSIDAIVEIMHISMSGCGTGYSVERAAISRLPMVEVQEVPGSQHLVVEDSQEGWEEALRFGLEAWWRGDEVTFDLSHVRPAGAVLKTKGGTASGPEPLQTMLEEVQAILKKASGRQLWPIEVFDILCHIGDCAIQGGVRRSASICLFDWDDDDMFMAKRGSWFAKQPQRANANISVVLPDKLSEEDLRFVMHLMDASGCGEPGVFSRRAWWTRSPERRVDMLHGVSEELVGTNPCGEILLRDKQFCNLSVAVLRNELSFEEIKERVELATIIGTIQASFTDFPRLRPQWKERCEMEALLGVDILGHTERPLTQRELEDLREHAIEVNQRYARLLGIEPAAAVTCNKPNGNLSVLLNTGAGLHRAFAPYYRRNVRLDSQSPLCKALKAAGFPMSPENGHDPNNPRTWVLHFPQKAPEGCQTSKDVTALEQLQWWHLHKTSWCEHNPSVTITYEPNEFEDILNWLGDHVEDIGGLSFLPKSDHTYDLAPYEEITAEEYKRAVAALPDIDWSVLYTLEQRDQTTAANEPACFAGACEVI